MGLTQITDNAYWDLYPAWSPDGGELAFLSWRANSLGLYGLDLVSGEVREVIDSPDHEADPDWGGDLIAFTRNSRIWIIEPNGSGARSLSNPPRAGEWGDANLPYGDYDPRISPDGSQVVFERLVDADSPHGGYDLFLIDLKTSQETRLTNVGYSLGLADWSPDGSQLVFIVSAVEGEGRYDLYLINADGSGLRDITPEYYPSNFLCRWVEFSADGKALYFVGEWWEQE
jgi:TolB protein